MSQTIDSDLQAQGDELAAQLPPEINEVFADEQAELESRPRPADAVRVGDTVEEFTLEDQLGRPRSLGDLVADGPAVLVFYRGGWCPFCNVVLRGYERDLVPALADQHASLVAISPERPDASLSTQEKNELSFSVLSDPGLVLARRLGITFEPVEAALQAQRTVGFDIRDWREDGATTLPYPTVLIIGTDRVVRFVDIQTNYVKRTSARAILDALSAS